MRVLALGTYDSFINVCSLISPYFEKCGCEVDIAIARARPRRQVSRIQISRAGLNTSAQWIDIEKLCRAQTLSSYDIVLCCLDGASMRKLNYFLSMLSGVRPILIAVYPGLILRYPFDGYSMRSGVDLLWLNCKADKEAYENMCSAHNICSSNARVFGIASLLKTKDLSPKISSNRVVFFEQTVIPRGYYERLYLVQSLAQLAQKFPKYEFIIKARALGKNKSLHRPDYAIDVVLSDYKKKAGKLPTNLKLTEEPASSLLATASHCLTVSSTVAVEAIHAGIPTAIIGDFGANDDYGLHYFYGSGLIKNFNQIELPFHAPPNKDWLNKNVEDPNENIINLVTEAISLAKKRDYGTNKEFNNLESSSELRRYIISNVGYKKYIKRRYIKSSKVEILYTKLNYFLRKMLGAI